MIPRIVKRGDSYSLCYRYMDHANKKHIKLEPCVSLDDARLRLEEVMQQQEKGIFIPPNAITVSELMEDFIRVCGSRKWVASTYTANIGLYRNYILPVLGSCGIQNLYSKDVDIYIRMLTKTISAASNVKEEPLYISALTIKKIIDLLRRAFQYAVNRDLVAQNPFENAVLPKTDILKKGVREIDY